MKPALMLATLLVFTAPALGYDRVVVLEEAYQED